jgi:hypothetical protein
MKYFISTILIASIFGGFSGSAWSAEKEPVRDRWQVNAGVFFIYDAETVIRLDSTNGLLGTTLSSSRDLGMDKDDTTGKISGQYRFNNHHSIRTDWYILERSGQKNIDIDINFGEEFFQANTDVISQFDTQIFDVLYEYSFYNTEKIEFAVQGGLHITSIDVSLQEVGGSGSAFQSADVTAPLPVIGFHMRYNFLPKLSTVFDWRTFQVDTGDFGGNLQDMTIAVEHRTFKHIGFGFGLESFNLELDATESTFTGAFDNRWDGVFLYLKGY